MIVFKKHRRKVDPVKQILARIDEKQSKTGLSLYSRTDVHEPAKEEVLPLVHPLSEATAVSSANSSFFPDLSAARQKARKRLNAGLQHAVDDSAQKAVQYMQAKADRQLNLTFPPAKSQGITAAGKQDRLGYAFSSWSDSPSAGVENLRYNSRTSLNPFGYNRRTLAFQPTSLNYVVEWPETWPLKIMSLGKGTGPAHRRKTKPKPKVHRKVHFETSSVSSNSRVISNKVFTENPDDPLPDQTKQVLPDIQSPLASVAVGSALQGPHVAECSTHSNHAEDLSQGWEHSCVDADRTMPSVEEGHYSDILRVYSDSSSISEGAFASVMEGRTAGKPHDAEDQQADSVPPCTPTPVKGETLDDASESILDSREGGGRGGEGKGGEVKVGNEQSHDQLMNIVTEIATETPEVDYMQDI